jgi:sortase A
MRIRINPGARLLAGSLTFLGFTLAAWSAAMLILGIWREQRDRDDLAAALAKGSPLLALPDPRARDRRQLLVLPKARSATPLGLGIVEIDRLGLSVLVRPSASMEDLDKGAGWVRGTARPGQSGNVVIAGHRDTFFRELRNIRLGDHVALLTPSGRKRYVVKQTLVVEPTETDVLQPTPSAMLTLVTCFPFEYIGTAPKRFIVRASALDAAIDQKESLLQ